MSRGTAVIESLQDEIEAALHALRPENENNGHLADDLLAIDSARRHLIGVSEDGDAVLVHDFRKEAVVRVVFGDGRLDSGKRETVVDTQDVSQIWTTIQDRGRDSFAWLHPRYRWLFAGEYSRQAL